MFQYILHFHRTEGAQSYMKGHMGDIYPLVLDRLQKFRCKMKSCSRCSCGSFMLCIDRLITVLILQLMCDIRRQRHLAQLIQDLFKDSFISEFNHTVAVFDHIQHFTDQQTITKADLRTWFCLLTRFHQCLPHIIFISLKQKYFNVCIRSHLTSHKTGRDYFRIIDYQTVSWIQIINDFTKNMVFDMSCFLIQYHQSGTGSILQRILSDQFLRKIIIKIM